MTTQPDESHPPNTAPDAFVIRTPQHASVAFAETLIVPPLEFATTTSSNASDASGATDTAPPAAAVNVAFAMRAAAPAAIITHGAPCVLLHERLDTFALPKSSAPDDAAAQLSMRTPVVLSCAYDASTIGPATVQFATVSDDTSA
jgi:hypothetical protein